MTRSQAHSSSYRHHAKLQQSDINTRDRTSLVYGWYFSGVWASGGPRVQVFWLLHRKWNADRSPAAQARETLSHLTFALLAWSLLLNLTSQSAFIDRLPQQLASSVILPLNLMMPSHWFVSFAGMACGVALFFSCWIFPVTILLFYAQHAVIFMTPYVPSLDLFPPLRGS